MVTDAPKRLRSVGARLDRLDGRSFFFLLFVPLLVLYFGTASRARPFSIDAHTNVLTAWKLGTEGTIYVDENRHLLGEPYFGDVIWLLESDGHAVGKYPPGAALFAAPFYAVAQSEGTVHVVAPTGGDGEPIPAEIVLPSAVPAALAASTAVAAAVGLMGLTARRFVSNRKALAAALVLGLGTAAWSVAADALWQHGPAMLWLSAALWFISRDAFLMSGLAFGLAVLTRPQLAVIPAAVGIIVALYRRSWRPVLLVGVGSSAGLAAYLTFNQVVFGSWQPPTPAGGYFVDALGSGSNWWRDLEDLWLALFDFERGLFIYSPFLLILLPGIRHGWRAAPDWVKAAAVGGILYLLVQLRGNVFSGGDAFFGYRYPIEMVVVAAPLLLMAYREWAVDTALAARVVFWSGGLSVAFHAYGSLAY